jgi:hypothetical protein
MTKTYFIYFLKENQGRSWNFLKGKHEGDTKLNLQQSSYSTCSTLGQPTSLGKACPHQKRCGRDTATIKCRAGHLTQQIGIKSQLF